MEQIYSVLQLVKRSEDDPTMPPMCDDPSQQPLAIMDWHRRPPSDESIVALDADAVAAPANSNPEPLIQMIQILEQCKAQCDDMEKPHVCSLEDPLKDDLEHFLGNEVHVVTLKDQTHGLPQCFAPLHPSSLE